MQERFRFSCGRIGTFKQPLVNL